MKFNLQKALLTGMALALISTSAAHATNYDITSSTAGPLTLNTGDALTVQSNGSVSSSGGSDNVQASGTPTGAIVNYGSITSVSERAISVTGTVSGGIDNNSGAIISSNNGHGIEVNGTVTADGNGNAIYNDGTISTTGDSGFPDSSAIRLGGGTITGNIFNDTGGVMSGYVYGVNLQGGTVTGSLINSGTISSTGPNSSNIPYAIWDNGGTVTGGITNNSGGIIESSTGDGIVIASSTTLGSISNQGTITSSSNSNGSYGIYIQGTVTTLTNTNGTISQTSVGNGLEVNGGTISTLNNNGGTISATTGYGLYNLSGTITSLTNTGGTISATSGFALLNQGTIGTLTNGTGGQITVGNGGYAILNSASGNMSLINNGLIHATDTVALYNAATMSLNNTNGTISATTGTAIQLNAALTGNLTNTGGLITSASTGNGTFYANADLGTVTITGGTISNTSTSNSAVAFNIAAAQSGNNQITFSNVNLIADGDTAGSGHGIALENGTNHALVNFVGNSVVRGNVVSGGSLTLDVNDAAITGNITLGGTGNELELLNTASINGTTAFGTGTNTATIASTFTTQGAFTTASGGQTNFTVSGGSFTANNAVGLGGGTITVDNGAALNLTAADVTTTGAFTNHGTTSINVGRTLSVGSIDTTATNGVLSFTANNSGSTLLTGHINTGATAANLSNQTVSVNYIGGVGLSTSSRSLIASGTGNATAPMAAVIDNSYLYGFAVTPGASDPNDLYLQASLLVSPTNASNTQNNANAANTLFSPTINSSDPVINQIQTNLLNAPTRQAYNNVVQSTLPTVDHGATSGAVNFTGDVFDVADSQLTTVDTGMRTGVAAGNETHGLHPWMQGFGSYATQGMRSDVPGYDASTYGAAFGLDTRELVDDTVLGLSFAYGRTNVNSNNTNNTTANVNTYQGMIYGNHPFAEDYFVTGMGAFGWDTNSENRQNVGAIAGLNASADYNSWQAATRWEVGRNFKDVPNNMTLTPSLTSDYLHYQSNGYTESGAGGADLHVGSQAENQLNLGLALQAEWLFETEDGSKLRPNLHASYKYDVLNDDAVDTTSSFAAGGGTFTTNGLNPDDSTYDLGTGIKFYNTGNWDFTATYDHTFKADYNSDSGIIRAAYSF